MLRENGKTDSHSEKMQNETTDHVGFEHNIPHMPGQITKGAPELGLKWGAREKRSAMVPWWKRLIYSFASTVLGASLCGAAAASQPVVANAHGHLNAEGLWTAILFFDPWVIALSLPGWLLALPLVLLIGNVRAWRFWVCWAAGICVGPLIVYIVEWIAASRGFVLAGIPGGLTTAYYLATAISALSSVFYLLLLRRGQTRAELRESAALV